MKDIKTYLISLTILVSHSILFAQNKYNLSFDDFDAEKQVMPNGWFKWGDFKNIAGEKLADENYVGKVVSDSDGKFGVITYRIPANYIGDTITLTGRIKHENVKGYVGLLMRIDGGSKHKVLAFENMQKFKNKGTSDWKEYEIKLPFSNSAKTIFVGGILSGNGVAWFDDFKVTIDNKDIQTLKETPKIYLKNYDVDQLKSALGKSSLPINLSTNDSLLSSLNPLIEKLADKRIVAIGENTHGTSEFYQLRTLITKKLIQEKEFNVIVLESPYDDIEIFNKNLSTAPLDSLIKKHLLSIYQTKEMKSFLQWYKDNRANFDIKFKGCDDSGWVFYELLENNLGSDRDKKLSDLLKKLQSNIAKSATTNFKKESKIGISIYHNIEAIENHLNTTNNLTEPVKEILFNGKSSYINYLNIANQKPIQYRDEVMAERISYLAKDTDNKIIVWAHNAHISNETIVDNEIGILGRELKRELGTNYHSIGLSTLNGSYSYIEEKFINGDHFYADRLKKAYVESSELPLWENSLAWNGSAFYLNVLALKAELKTDEMIGATKLIGYGKETKKDIYRIPLMKHFDSLIFIKNTSATTPLFD